MLSFHVRHVRPRIEFVSCETRESGPLQSEELKAGLLRPRLFRESCEIGAESIQEKIVRTGNGSQLEPWCCDDGSRHNLRRRQGFSMSTGVPSCSEIWRNEESVATRFPSGENLT